MPTFKTLFIYFLVLFLPPFVGWYIIGANEWDLSVPFVYGMHDDVWQLLLTKGLFDNGWVLHNAYLGAPDVANWHYHSAAQSSSLHSILLKFISIFIAEPIKAQQIYYFINFSLISLTSYVTCRALKISTLLSIAVGIIFSLTTFRFNAIFYSFLGNYFMIPLAILVIVWSSIGIYSRYNEKSLSLRRQLFLLLRNKKFLLSLIIISLTAISDGYYAFFTILLFGFCSILVIFSSKKYNVIDSAIPLCFAFLIITINLLVMIPIQNYKEANFDEFNPKGIPDQSLVRKPMEAEVYSSSFKLLIAPSPSHQVQFVGNIARKMIDSSDEARAFPTIVPIVPLGTVGGFCFIFTLFVLMFRSSSNHNANLTYFEDVNLKLKSLALLSLFVFLCSISGGIGTIIALIYPTIRAYDRFPLFLLFLVLVTFSYWITSKYKEKFGNRLFVLTIFFATTFSVWDQTPRSAYKPFTLPHVSRFIAEDTFIKSIESQLPSNSMVYQYPYSQYLSDNKYYGWGAFSHMRAYLHSKSLRWSNGASKNSKVDLWHEKLSRIPLIDRISQLSLYGFSGILIDRLVVSDDEFDKLQVQVLDKYGLKIKTNDGAKMAFVKLPNLGFKLIYDDKFEFPSSVEIMEPLQFSSEHLPSYINRDILLSLIRNDLGSTPQIILFNQHPGLFDAELFNLSSGNLQNNLPTDFLLGDLSCMDNIILDVNSSAQFSLRVKNNSRFDWYLNSGTRPIAIGFHLYDLEGNLLIWDNGYRYSNSSLIKVSTSNELRVKVSDLNLDLGSFPDNNFNIEFMLLQEGNSWFNVNPSNKMCRVKIVKGG
ncbi:hypothetical protein F0249_11945 [Vibrio sp. 03-59-1]|uniref:hypothetical protein n=1 Tax=Vibrio sp. 03-59-1 TaxID=2607607 RepID=UPI0014938D49|nr:hypothetical protein [Vibrio sp. 03-59-1]NOH84526.1 hypothetical protein [Vibrio sp. 03-59-1]